MQSTTKAQMLFIGELNGFKSGSYEDKVNYGINCYANHKLHDLNMDNEDDRAENFENIWLQRLYKELDAVHGVSCPMSRVLAIDTEDYADTVQWSVPIELDAGALA
jgi:hypothetical protein